MKIAFYDTKPYDKIWFDIVAREEGFEVFYFEDKLNSDTITYASGCDVISYYGIIEISAAVLKKIKDSGIRVVLVRSAFDTSRELVKYEKEGIVFIKICSSMSQNLIKSKWVSYLP